MGRIMPETKKKLRTAPARPRPQKKKIIAKPLSLDEGDYYDGAILEPVDRLYKYLSSQKSKTRKVSSQ